MLYVIRCGLFAGSIALMAEASVAQGVNQNAPVLNGIGRFLGVGYSQGYHANQQPARSWGQLRNPHVKPYIDPSLTAIYEPGYNSRVHYGGAWSNPVMGQPTPAELGGHSSILQPNNGQPSKNPPQPTQPKSAPALADPGSSPSDKPVSPPPPWLEKYLPPKNPPASPLPEPKPPAKSDELPKPTQPARPQPAVKLEPAEELLPTEPPKKEGEDDDLLGPATESDEDLLLPGDSAGLTGQANRYTARRLTPSRYRYPNGYVPTTAPSLQLTPRY